MKIPKTINILGFDIAIRFEHDMPRTKNGMNGCYDGIKKIITLSTENEKEEQLRVFLHEILEVINRELFLELDHDKQMYKLDTAWFQILKSNRKEFIKILEDL